MKGRSLILIFLFLICVTQPVFAEEGSIHWQSSSSSTATATGGGPKASGTLEPVYMYFADAETLQGLKKTIITVPVASTTVSGGDGTSGWDTSVTLRYGSTTGPVVGTGIYGYELVGSNYVISVISWLDFDVTAYSGTMNIYITDSTISVIPKSSNIRFVTGWSGFGADDVIFRYRYYFGSWQVLDFGDGGTTSITDVSYDYYNNYSYNSYETHNYFEMYRTVYNGSNISLEINGTWDNESAVKSTDYQKLSTDVDNNTWNFIIDNLFGETKNLQVNFVPVYGEASAVIEFNQSYFSSPDIVGVEYNIQNIDPVNFEYWILLTGTNGGIKYFVTNDYYDITTATGQDNFTISYPPLSLPFTMQAELWQYSKVSGESSVLAFSSEVPYNPVSLAPGSIWTQKDNYNISEIFYIEFNTNYNSVQIELISATFHDLRTMEGPGAGHLGYLFNEPHNFTAYLIEGGVKTNYVDFTVSADTPFLNIHVNSVPVNQGFCFSYYTDNTSDVITGYRPDGSIFYGPITDLDTLEKIDICGPSSSGPAGTYTMSLLHDGTEYYNDTIEMTSANEYIYFEASKYETGDRMVINYYIMDSRQRIRLSDSIGTAVITWTCDAFYITPNMGNSLWFSLTDNNEYGMNVLTSIDAGSFRTGNWKVEIIDIDGKPLTNESTYDYTTVSREIESPADATNEFIMILFSPEGLFLIFTACLTMMGLVAAHHPAGGAAGAVVGVGFGTYFNVLPIWMLLLMVIALVVLAGVSVAVYFKGKT